MNAHDTMLDDVAAYAIGALSEDDAARVRAHLPACTECQTELRLLQPAVTAVGLSAESRDQHAMPSPLLKERIMRDVRSTREMRRPRARTGRQPVWPAYLVAAACFAIALISSLANLSLMQQLRQTQGEASAASTRSNALARTLTTERATLADLLSTHAQRYDVAGGQIVRLRNHLYIAMHDMPPPPRGKVYQAWTQTKGSSALAPSLTFVPDPHGVAVVALPVDAQTTNLVAVSVEPEGGSRSPTSKPVAVATLN